MLPQNTLCGAVLVPVCCESGYQGLHPMKRCDPCTRAGGSVKFRREKLSPLPPFKQLAPVVVVLLLPSPQIKKNPSRMQTAVNVLSECCANNKTFFFF